ncbi:MAG: MBL fold metallo-hydrolase [Burkholderiales bacterium]|nr:MBL fold metallo-hydrolase [Burkholderiales bacterium]
MQPIQLFDPESCTYTYLLVCPHSGEAVLIDPVDHQLERDLVALSEQNARLVWVIETHAHADHITSAGMLVEHTGAHAAVPAGCGIRSAARQLQEGDVIKFGQESVTALHTPGHTAGSMSYHWRDHVFTGDTLLIDGCGRTDFQSGSADDLYTSITEKLFTLPPDTTVWPGHDYKGRTSSSIGHELTHNSRLARRSRADFIALMNELNLPRPRLIDVAVPANLALGLQHHAGADDSDAPRAAAGYAGDVTPELAYRWWKSGQAALVDIRTDAEREWVGFVPGAVALAWKQWPGMAMNATFDDDVRAVAPGKPLLMLCRSGVRSVAAAKRATELGLTAYNILEGFEGDPNGEAHRGKRGGWKHRGLPWRQN